MDNQKRLTAPTYRRIRHLLFVLISFTSIIFPTLSDSAAIDPASSSLADITQHLCQEHPEQSGAFVLEKGGDALLTRAWLADRAGASIDVQYFIWSTDNIGILAAESLLRAADRGVRSG